jgi:hypothetical protein
MIMRDLRQNTKNRCSAKTRVLTIINHMVVAPEQSGDAD